MLSAGLSWLVRAGGYAGSCCRVGRLIVVRTLSKSPRPKTMMTIETNFSSTGDAESNGERISKKPQTMYRLSAACWPIDLMD